MPFIVRGYIGPCSISLYRGILSHCMLNFFTAFVVVAELFSKASFDVLSVLI